MSFDVCSDCSDSGGWASAIRLALVWGFPTIFWVLRKQMVGRPSFLAISWFLWWAIAGAAAYTIFGLGLLEVEEPVQRAVLLLLAKGAIVSGLVIALVRRRRASVERWQARDDLDAA